MVSSLLVNLCVGRVYGGKRQLCFNINSRFYVDCCMRNAARSLLRSRQIDHWRRNSWLCRWMFDLLFRVTEAGVGSHSDQSQRSPVKPPPRIACREDFSSALPHSRKTKKRCLKVARFTLNFSWMSTLNDSHTRAGKQLDGSCFLPLSSHCNIFEEQESNYRPTRSGLAPS